MAGYRKQYFFIAVGTSLMIVASVAVYNLLQPGLDSDMQNIDVVPALPPEMILNNSENYIEEEQDAATVTAKWYTPLTSFTLGRISLQASIADTEEERAHGLSDTPYIPAGIAKLFIFDTSEQWSFWMKDMQYPIDIFWLDENGHVVYIVENATPDTYPSTSFTPPVPARYVIETKAGFAAENHIRIGEVAGMTQILRTIR